MRYPLFVYLKLKDGKNSGSKVQDLLDDPYLCKAWKPYEVLEMVLERIVRDRPMHVVDLLEIQNNLQYRYGARKEVVAPYRIGMVRLKMTPWGEKQVFCDSDTWCYSDDKKQKLTLAIDQRDRAWKRLGKVKKAELKKNRELRELFFLTNEMKGMLNAETRFWRT